MSVPSIVKESRETSPLNHSEYSADLEEAMASGADEVEPELVFPAVLDELAEAEQADSAEL